MDDPFQQIVQEADAIKLRLAEVEDALAGSIDEVLLDSIRLIANGMKVNRECVDFVLEHLTIRSSLTQLK